MMDKGCVGNKSPNPKMQPPLELLTGQGRRGIRETSGNGRAATGKEGTALETFKLLKIKDSNSLIFSFVSCSKDVKFYLVLCLVCVTSGQAQPFHKVCSLESLSSAAGKSCNCKVCSLKDAHFVHF